MSLAPSGPAEAASLKMSLLPYCCRKSVSSDSSDALSQACAAPPGAHSPRAAGHTKQGSTAPWRAAASSGAWSARRRSKDRNQTRLRDPTSAGGAVSARASSAAPSTLAATVGRVGSTSGRPSRPSEGRCRLLRGDSPADSAQERPASEAETEGLGIAA
eukprot:scaffold5115_cov113-Isochrysis_galbana.AAC.7